MRKALEMNEKNVALLCDFYEFTMGNGYFLTGKTDKSACFDVYFRKVPDGGGYVIAAGLEAIIDFIDNLKFTDEDIEMLRNKKIFDEGFLSYLKNFKFECDVRDKGVEDMQSRRRQTRFRVRNPPRAGNERCGNGRPRRIYRRLYGNGVRYLRKPLRYPRRRNDGSQLGPDVRQRT